MIIFLYGLDTYRSREKLHEIIANYQKIHKSGLNLKYFLGTETDFDTLKDELRQTSMFKEKKLIILVDIFSNSEFKERFLESGKSLNKFWLGDENIILFYEQNSVLKEDPLLLFLKKYSQSQEFQPLGGQKLKSWAKKEFENYGAKIEEKALDKLIDFVGNDLWQMVNEIKKLVSYRAPRQRGEGGEEGEESKLSSSPFAVARENEVLFDHRAFERSEVKEESKTLFAHKKGVRIELEDVELLVRPKIETDIFETIDAIASKDKKRALKFIKAHLERGDSPLYLFSMIVFQFRNLLMVKDLIERNLPSYFLTGLHPFVIKKSILLSNKFRFLELKKIYQKIFQIDIDIKTGKIEPEIALDLLITELPSEAR